MAIAQQLLGIFLEASCPQVHGVHQTQSSIHRWSDFVFFPCSLLWHVRVVTSSSKTLIAHVDYDLGSFLESSSLTIPLGMPSPIIIIRGVWFFLVWQGGHQITPRYGHVQIWQTCCPSQRHIICRNVQKSARACGLTCAELFLIEICPVVHPMLVAGRLTSTCMYVVLTLWLGGDVTFRNDPSSISCAPTSTNFLEKDHF